MARLVFRIYAAVIYWCCVQSLEIAHCVHPLGMESGDIRDDQITASSSFDMGSVGPQNARIRKELNGGAWCPKRQIAKDVREYLEIDLREWTVVTAVETQGRFGNGQGQEFAEHYQIEYWRPGINKWIRFKNRKGDEIFQGNVNTYIGVEREVSPPIIATKIRFVPFSIHPRTVCMRVEVYGCNWTDGVVSYSMPQGERRGQDIDLFDMTYDGIEEENYLYGGLGQLTDGQRGQDNFRLDPNGLGKGYEWVGWRNDSSVNPGRPVEITFEFDSVRNFSAAYLFTNNLFTKDVQVFAQARFLFSVGGRYFNGEPVLYSYMPDLAMENARNVSVRLHHRIAKYVRVQLHFSARWIMVSEVSFDSAPAIGNFSEEVEHKPYVPPVYVDPIDFYDANMGVSTAMSDESMNGQYVGLVIGVLTAVILLLMLIIFVIVTRSKQRKQSNSHTVLKPTEKRVVINMKELSMGVINGGVYGHIAPDDLDSSDKSSFYQEPYSSKTPLHQTNHNQSTYKNGLYGVGSTPRKLPDPPLTTTTFVPDYCVREYAIPDISKTTQSSFATIAPVPLLPGPPSHPPPPAMNGNAKTPPVNFPLRPIPASQNNQERHYAATDICQTNFNLQGVSGNTVYAVPNVDVFSRDSLDSTLAVCEFPRHKLRFLEKLGEGQFGEVWLLQVNVCEADGIPELVDVPTFGTSKIVAVKVLRKSATEAARNEFMKEIRVLSRLQDPNIVRVLGVCTRDEPLALITEYPEYGDLCQFLQGHVAPSDAILQNNNSKYGTLNSKTLSYGSLIYIATEVTSGMKYLESLNFVHRDLAARNCLVGSNYSIKIADYGMSRDMYEADYYGISQTKTKLPVRWMAWESLLLGKFTCKSDVWAFAVTLWEILTYARDRPYPELTDEKVIENVGHFYHNNGKQVYLPQPPNCPKEIYDLMRECWQRNENSRPNFREIHLFLQRKNLGYQPDQEPFDF